MDQRLVYRSHKGNLSERITQGIMQPISKWWTTANWKTQILPKCGSHYSLQLITVKQATCPVLCDLNIFKFLKYEVIFTYLFHYLKIITAQDKLTSVTLAPPPPTASPLFAPCSSALFQQTQPGDLSVPLHSTIIKQYKGSHFWILDDGREVSAENSMGQSH